MPALEVPIFDVMEQPKAKDFETSLYLQFKSVTQERVRLNICDVIYDRPVRDTFRTN